MINPNSEFTPLETLFNLAEEVLPMLEAGDMDAVFDLDDQLPSYPALLALLLAWANSEAAKDASRYPAFEFLMHKGLESLRYAVRQGDEEGRQWLDIIHHNLKLALQDNNELLCRNLIRGCADMDLVLPEDIITEAAEWHFENHEQTGKLADSNVLRFPERPEALMNELLEDLQPEEASQIYEVLKPELHYLPAEGVALIAASLLASPEPMVRNTALLFLLHPRPAVRDAIIKTLGDDKLLNDIDAGGRNRLVALRHYLPKAQAEQLDKVVKSLNRRNLVQAETSPGEVQLWASAMDGSGATAITALRKAGSKWQISGIILKEQVGIVDCWESDPVSKSKANKTLALIRENMPQLVAVNEQYLHTLIPHYLHLNKTSGELPEPILLEWLEKLGDGLWQPNRFDFERWLQEQRPEANEKEEDQAFTRLAIWFEREQEQLRWWELGETFTDLAEDLLDSINNQESVDPVDFYEDAFGLVRDKWVERFIQLSLWAQCDTNNKIPQWRDFALLAQAIKDGLQVPYLPIIPHIINDSIQAAVETITGFTEDDDDPDWLEDDVDWKDDELGNQPFTPDLFNKPATSRKVGHNEPCPCGSGKKYKKCCGK